MNPAQWLAVLAVLEAHLPHTHPLIRVVADQWQQARAANPTPTTSDQEE